MSYRGALCPNKVLISIFFFYKKCVLLLAKSLSETDSYVRPEEKTTQNLSIYQVFLLWRSTKKNSSIS